MAEMKIGITDVIEKAIEKIKAEGYTVQKWIPCSERLPEENVSVLCYMRIGEIVVMEYGGDGWYCGVTRYNQRAVTHWMPLPEPPESEVQHD